MLFNYAATCLYALSALVMSSIYHQDEHIDSKSRIKLKVEVVNFQYFRERHWLKIWPGFYHVTSYTSYVTDRYWYSSPLRRESKTPWWPAQVATLVLVTVAGLCSYHDIRLSRAAAMSGRAPAPAPAALALMLTLVSVSGVPTFLKFSFSLFLIILIGNYLMFLDLL